MWSRLLREQRSVELPVTLLVVGRIVNTVIGLAVMPILIYKLGGDGFAAWALLLALAAAFSLFELGAAPTYVKFVAPLVHAQDWPQIGRIQAGVLAILLVTFSVGGIAVAAFCQKVAAYLGLPDAPLLTAAQMIFFVFVCSAMRGLLQVGTLSLNAARRFAALAAASFLQSFTSNVIAAIAAIWTGRLDITLIAYWGAQLTILVAVCAISRVFILPSARLGLPRRADMLQLCGHGLKVQVYDWAQVISYQYDKFVIAATIGLSAVPQYEVGNRSALALRSIPASGIDSFLATAAIHQQDVDQLWTAYERVTGIAVLAAFTFLLAPIAVGPLFLVAWIGEIGYPARWIFLCLALGAACSVVAMPAASLVQSMGRADLHARSALLALCINVPMSIMLVHQWGVPGVAVGTAIAMASGAGLLLIDTHKACGRSVTDTIGKMVRFGPLLLICAAVGVLSWISTDYAVSRYGLSAVSTPSARFAAAALAIATYGLCVGLMLLYAIRRRMLTLRPQTAVWLGRR